MEDEIRRLENKSSSFRGSAKIHLKHLLFEEPKDVSLSLHLDPKNVARLIKIFELEGCLRLEEEHRVPAIINDAILQEALNSSSLTNAELLTTGVPPELQIPQSTRLNCLHGRHRIAAAQQILLPGNRWWTVDLYTEGLGESTYRDLREEYANERNFCDGDIYRHLRQSQLKGDSNEEGRWLARLSECKRKDVKQLQRRSELRPLTNALDSLLPFLGFWPALQIGTFHRLFSLKCPEELECYLRHIQTQWDSILGGNHNCRCLVDFRTVQLLQTRNPSSSCSDLGFVREQMPRSQCGADIEAEAEAMFDMSVRNDVSTLSMDDLCRRISALEAQVEKRDIFVGVKRFHARADHSTRHIDRLQMFLEGMQSWSNQVTECLYDVYLGRCPNYVPATPPAQVDPQQL